MRCKGCGAPFDTHAHHCPYCGKLTPHGSSHMARAAEQAGRDGAAREQAEREREQAQLNRARQAMLRSARHALLWPLSGMLFCLVPIPALVGIVMWWRARAAARTHVFILPHKATVGMVLAVVQLCLGVGFWTYLASELHRVDERRQALTATTRKARKQLEIEQQTACDLVELHLLNEGFGEDGPINIQAFDCSGKLEREGEHAFLHDVRFSKHTCQAELRFGARWSVAELTGPDCQTDEVPTETQHFEAKPPSTLRRTP